MTRGLDPLALSSPDWLLAGIDTQRDLYHLAHVNRETYHQSSFLDHRIKPLPQESESIGGNLVDQVFRQHPSPAASWITHTGFCCSTLLASCLDHPGVTLALREPLVLSRLASLIRESRPLANPNPVIETSSQRVIRLCERNYPQEKTIIKPSNFANVLLPELLKAIPRQAGTGQGEGAQRRKIIFLSGSLRALLLSILKKREEAERALPGFLQALLADSDYMKKTGLASVVSLDLLQQSVVFWHCQRYFFSAYLSRSNSNVLFSLSMERFLAEPFEALNEVSQFLGLGLGESVLEETVFSGAFRRHSKNPAEAYDSMTHRNEQLQTSVRFDSEIAAALSWAQPLLDALPVEPLDAFEAA